MCIGLYQLKHEVEAKDQIVQQLHQNYLEDQRAIRVLKAEWAYLNSPAYLQELAGRHLRLRPTAPSQILHSPSIIPLRTGLSARLAPQPEYRYPAPRQKPRPETARAGTRVGQLIVRFERAISRGTGGGGP
jgi:hypothetical protein